MEQNQETQNTRLKTQDYFSHCHTRLHEVELRCEDPGGGGSGRHSLNETELAKYSSCFLTTSKSPLVSVFLCISTRV